MDILQNTNFFRAFTTSASVPAIYIQQFWNTLTYVEKAGTYRFQLDEDWFTLDANLLREALEITPIDQAHLFVSPPSGDAIMDFVNELGYPEVIHFVSSMAVNHLYQPWRAILFMINQCLTCKTSGHDRPRYPVLQMLWGIITSTNVDYAELIWEEFMQAIQTFLTDKANLGSPIKKGRKDKPYVIPYCRFMKLIICHLGRIHNIHQRSASPFHLAEEDLRLGNLKFVSKGKIDEVFGMPIPNELISNNIRNAPYYNAYLEMTSSAKPPKAQAWPKKVTKATPLQNLAMAHSEPEPEHQGEGEEFDMERAIQMSLESFQAQGHARVRGVAIQEPIAEAIRPLPVVEGKGEIRGNVLHNLSRPVLDTDPGESLESRTQPEQVYMDEDQAGPDPGISRVALAGPDPEPMHNEFMADLYPKVQESLNFSADEHVIIEDPLSETGTLSSMKNLEDAYAIEDQFINDKSTDDEPGKLNVEAEVVFMVIVPIYQASSSVPPLSTPLIDLSPPKPTSSTTQTPIFTATTTTTPLPPPPQQQSTTESEVYTLELRDLPHKIDEAVHENVKEVVQIALQAPLRDRFRDLSEEDMKEMLHQRMFETGSYKSLLEHIALYKALEASMELAQRDKFLDEKDKSFKHRRDDQDPPPPPLDSDLSKKRRHDTGVSGSSHSQAPQSSAWKKSDTRDAPSSSSKQ
ncbi:hypothetical protein Tco_0475911 [Tanacetum coccineum]